MTHNAQRITTALVLIAALTLFAGCSGTRSLRKPANNLDEVNTKLARRWVSIHLKDGSELVPRYNVQLGTDSVRFSRRVERMAVATSEVTAIYARRNPGGKWGALLGAAALPGLVNFLSPLGHQAFTPVAVEAGIIALPGAVLGYMAGSSTMSYDYLVYECPVENYRD